MDVTIVIPVKNGGKLLGEVLHTICEQQTDYQYEVICIDSGSTDGTQDMVRAYGFKLYEILPQEFGHGKTRNLGASLGSGEFICFLTQDAMPASEYWLQNMIDAMKMDQRIAGGFGIHYPYPNCNLPDRQMLQEHFARFGAENKIFFLTEKNRKRYIEDDDYRQFLAFFSDNNSCLRRNIWEKLPFDDVDYAEDQFWARKILEAGYGKVYCPKAGVYHSHNYPLKAYGKRYYDDFKAMYRVYGLVLGPTLVSFLLGALKDVKHQYSYILRQKCIGVGKKMYWCYYSVRRILIRRIASVRAVRYFSLSENGREKMDQKYSKEYIEEKK